MSDHISIPEAARRSSVPEKAIRQGCRSGYIQSIKRGRVTYIPIEEYDNKIAPLEFYSIDRAAAHIGRRMGISKDFVSNWLTRERGCNAMIHRTDLVELAEGTHLAWMNPL